MNENKELEYLKEVIDLKNKIIELQWELLQARNTDKIQGDIFEIGKREPLPLKLVEPDYPYAPVYPFYPDPLYPWITPINPYFPPQYPYITWISTGGTTDNLILNDMYENIFTAK